MFKHIMKKTTITFLLVILLFPLSSCNRSNNNSNKVLSIAFYGDMYKPLVDSFKLKSNMSIHQVTNDKGESNENFLKQIRTEIMSGKGPDVIISQKNLNLDLNKMDQAGAFCDINELIPQDDTFSFNDYFDKVIKGVQQDGKQYIFPLTFDIPVLLSGEEFLKKYNFNINECTDTLSFFSTLESCSTEAIYSEGSHLQLIRIPLLSREFYNYYGVDWINAGQTLTEKKVEELCSLYKKTLYPNVKAFQKSGTSIDLTGINGAKDIYKQTSVFEQTSFVYTLYNAQAISTFDTPKLVPIYDKNGGIRAEVQDAIMINANSNKKVEAFSFIKYLLDEQVNLSVCLDIPVNRKGFESALLEFGKKTNVTDDLKWDNFEEFTILPALSEEFKGDYRVLLNKISDSYVATPLAIKQAFSNEMTPFFEDESTFSECMRRTILRIERYVSE